MFEVLKGKTHLFIALVSLLILSDVIHDWLVLGVHVVSNPSFQTFLLFVILFAIVHVKQAVLCGFEK
ncbi:MAG: hypothetical protein ACI97K_000331 [Glaciecola sp.]|jgi:hypothetical protein